MVRDYLVALLDLVFQILARNILNEGF